MSYQEEEMGPPQDTVDPNAESLSPCSLERVLLVRVHLSSLLLSSFIRHLPRCVLLGFAILSPDPTLLDLSLCTILPGVCRCCCPTLRS